MRKLTKREMEHINLVLRLSYQFLDDNELIDDGCPPLNVDDLCKLIKDVEKIRDEAREIEFNKKG